MKDIIFYTIIIQKYIRRFLIKKNILIPNSSFQTKQWRKNQVWYKNGKLNECEKYQKKIIKKICNIDIISTNERIDTEKYSIINIKNIFKNTNAFIYTEDFDGKFKLNNNLYYFNLKFVCDKGGSQNRTMREVYHFINYQIQYIENRLIKNLYNNTHFINILDGDQFFINSDKYYYLINKYPDISKYIFIGDMNKFQSQYKKFIV